MGEVAVTDNPIKIGVAPVRSPWGSFDVLVLPDDDDEARKAGFPDDVIALATQEHPVIDGKTMFVRSTLWERVKAVFFTLGQRH